MMVDLMELELISCIKTKNKAHIDIYRNKWGKFYVRNDGTITQRNLNAKEAVRYLAEILEGK